MNSTEEFICTIMVSYFGIDDLQALLGAFNYSRIGQKNELKDRVLDLLKSKPPGLNVNAFTSKIEELYRIINRRRLSIRLSFGDVEARRSFWSQSQNVPTGSWYEQQQRIYLSPQYVHQPIQTGMPYQRNIQSERSSLSDQEAQRLFWSQQQDVPTGSWYEQQQRIYLSPQYVHQPMLTTGMPYQQTGSLRNVQFKKWPFFHVAGEVLKPSIMTGFESCTLPSAANKGMKEVSFKITLTREHCNLILLNRDISNGKNEYIYQVQIRICQIQQDSTEEISDCLPYDLLIRLNNKFCLLPPLVPRVGPHYKRMPLPIDCTNFMILRPNVINTMILNWIPDDNTYIISMNIVKKLNSDILLKALQEKESRSSDETKNYIIKKFTDVDPDLTTTKYRFSLLCPLSKMRMKIPAKSIKCDHLQCFDAISYLQMNERKPTWMCPTCKSPCLFDDIRIESYFLEVITNPEISNDIMEIEILANGTWKVCKEWKESGSVADYKNQPIDSIELDSSDDNIDESLIELTFSVDEESPNKEEKQENKAQAVNEKQSTTNVDLHHQAKTGFN